MLGLVEVQTVQVYVNNFKGVIMKNIILKTFITPILFLMSINIYAWTMTPDGSYVGGNSYTMTPDGFKRINGRASFS